MFPLIAVSVYIPSASTVIDFSNIRADKQKEWTAILGRVSFAIPSGPLKVT